MTPYKETRPIKRPNGETSVQVRWRLNVGSKGKRVRKDFSTQADAQRYAAATKTLKHRVGVTAMMTLAALPDKHLADVVTAIDLVDRLFPGKAISLADLVRQAAAVSAATPKIVHKKLTDALDEYLDECKDKMDPTWHRTLGGCLRKIARLLGDVDVHEVTAELIEEAFEDMGWPSITTWNHHRAYFLTFFKWAAKKTTKKPSYLGGDNPADAVPILEKNRDEKEDIAIPPPEYRHKLVETARQNPHVDMEGYLTLTFDLGLRTSEAMRLTWADYNDEDKDPDLKVTASKAKSGATRTLSLRHPLLLRVKEVLDRIPKKTGSIVPRNLRERRDELCRLAGLPWFQGVGRKSFGTFFYKHTGDDVTTRSVMGHLGDAKIFLASYRAADVIENNIRRRVTSTDAEVYFGVPIIYSKEMPTVA